MAHRAHGKDLRELEHWINFNTGWSKARDDFLPLQTGRESSACRALSVCFEELVQHVALYHPGIAKLQERVWTRVLAVVAAVLSQARNDEQVLAALRENLARAQREHSEYVRTVGPRTEELEKEGQALRQDLATAQARLQSVEREAMALANENERLRAIVAEGLEESHVDGEQPSAHVLDEAAPAAMAEALRLAGQENVRQVNLLSSLNQVMNDVTMRAMALVRTGQSVRRMDKEVQTELEMGDLHGQGAAQLDDGDARPPVPPPPEERARAKGRDLPLACRRVMSSCPTAGRPSSLRSAKKRALELLLAKVTFDRNREDGTPRLGAASVVYQFLFNHYGLVELTDWHMSAYIATIRSHAGGCKRLRLWSRLLGADRDPDEEPSVPDSGFHFLGDLLASMMEADQLPHVVQDSDESCFVSSAVRVVQRALSAVPGACPFDPSHRRQAVVPLLKELLSAIASPTAVHSGEEGARSLSLHKERAKGRGGELRDVDLDDMLEFALGLWERADAQWDERLAGAFYAHATVVRLGAYGQTDHALPADAAGPELDSPARGTRCVLDVSSCSEALLEMAPSLGEQEVCGGRDSVSMPRWEGDPPDPPQAQAAAVGAAQAWRGARVAAFEGLWRSHHHRRGPFAGQEFYYNVETRETAWERPAFDPDPSEIDYATFRELCKDRNVGCQGTAPLVMEESATKGPGSRRGRSKSRRSILPGYAASMLAFDISQGAKRRAGSRRRRGESKPAAAESASQQHEDERVKLLAEEQETLPATRLRMARLGQGSAGGGGDTSGVTPEL